MIQDGSYVRTLHSFVAPETNDSQSCLSFQAGTLIKTLNKDTSGWWDGEIIGTFQQKDGAEYLVKDPIMKRGWFPSNYVETASFTVAMLTEGWTPPRRSGTITARTRQNQNRRPEVNVSHKRSASSSATDNLLTPSESFSSLSTTSTGITPDTASSSNSIVLQPENAVSFEQSPHTVLYAMKQSISQITGSVKGRRVGHYQPSTACVITSVRAILSATDCLARESTVLAENPTLLPYRKIILSSLTMLVDQTRRTVAPNLSLEHRVEHEQQLLKRAETVKRCVADFMDEIIRLGIPMDVPDSRKRDPDSLGSSFKSKTIRGAKSLGDLKTYDLPKYSSPSQQRPPVPNLKKMPSMRVLASSVSPPTSPATSYFPSPQTPSTTLPDSSEFAPSGPININSIEELSRLLTSIDDQLLSNIASFIGHVHAHTRASHSASYAYLIDMTRENIEKVRELLVVVEAVTAHSAFSSLPEMVQLHAGRDALYQAITRLVTASRAATSQPAGDEDEEKNELLTSATNVLRAGGECVSLVKVCLAVSRQRPGAPFSLVLPELELPTHTFASSLPLDRGALDETDGLRGHTLSMLGRKATSLTSLRDQFHLEGDQRPPMFPNVGDDGMELLGSDEQTITGPNTISSYGHRKNDSVSLQIFNRKGLRVDTTSMSYSSPCASDSTASSRSQSNASSGTGETSPRSSPSPAETKPPNMVSAASRQVVTSPVKQGGDKPWFLERDYEAKEISFNAEGRVTGGTVSSLLERMTLHDTTIDPSFSHTFFLTFRMFSSSLEVCNLLLERFMLQPPAGILSHPEEFTLWKLRKAVPVRLRIYNFFKTWIEIYWQDSDVDILETLTNFAKGPLAMHMPQPSERLLDLISKRRTAGNNSVFVKGSKNDAESDKDHYSLTVNSDGTPRSAPIVSRSMLNSLRTLPHQSFSILELDATELARQLTIMESRMYCKIRPEELVRADMSKKLATVNVRAMSTTSTRLTGWIAETILHENDTKRRTQLLKFFIKLADKCMMLNNYNTLMAVLCALNSSTVVRLRKTWEGVPTKYRTLWDGLKKATEHSRNYAEYRLRIRTAVPPCLPFLGLYLTDLTFSLEGNPEYRTSPADASLKLVNFDRYQKISKIVGDLQRFQVPYNLIEVPEIQNYLSQSLENLGNGGDATTLYRRSILIEPREIVKPRRTKAHLS